MTKVHYEWRAGGSSALGDSLIYVNVETEKIEAEVTHEANSNRWHVWLRGGGDYLSETAAKTAAEQIIAKR